MAKKNKFFRKEILPLGHQLLRMKTEWPEFESAMRRSEVSWIGQITPTQETIQDEQEDKTIYKVVVNHEEQYSIWPANRENALGWRDEGKVGPKAECLAHIKEVWTDMRPLSLRMKMDNPSPGA